MSRPRKNQLSLNECIHLLKDKAWRMQNLYWILDEDGKEIHFSITPSLHKIWNSLWYRNIILKSRKQYVSTFWLIYGLDQCLFNNGYESDFIYDTEVHAFDAFRRTVIYAYDHMNRGSWLDFMPLTKRTDSHFVFKNNSSIAVGPSTMSKTPQLLVVSEFGYTCEKFPEKAREIIKGSLQSVSHSGQQVVVIESTARGSAGSFRDFCDTSRKLWLPNKDKANDKWLTKLDWRFHFLAWFDKPENRLTNADAKKVPINSMDDEYFRKVQTDCSVIIDHNQRAWYVKIRDGGLGDDILSEHPSTPEEAFMSSHESTFFYREFTRIRESKRICKCPYQGGSIVNAFWDLGVRGGAIWFISTIGREKHVIDYYENNGPGIEHYKEILDERRKQYGYLYGKQWAPHDVVHREKFTGATISDLAANIGLFFDRVPKVSEKIVSIQYARNIMAACVFDEEKCKIGIEHLESYRRTWDAAHNQWTDVPVDDEHAHCADAFQQFAMVEGMQLDSQQERNHVSRIIVPSGRWKAYV